jgi:hypothetical protein
MGKSKKQMIPENAPELPEEIQVYMTLEEKEKLTRLRQERQDAAREARDLLLSARSRDPADHRPTVKLDEFVTEGLSLREREGLGLLRKREFEEWCDAHIRGCAAVRAQARLKIAVARRAKRGERP